MSELQILIFNAAVFSILAVYHYWKNRKLNIAFYILAYYSICAWGALLYHEHELFHYMRGRETYSIIPFLYLIPVIFLFAYPIIRYDNTRITRIETLNSNFFINLVWILLFIQIVLYIILFPSFLKAILQSPNQKIPNRKTKCVIETHLNIKQNVILGANLKPV